MNKSSQIVAVAPALKLAATFFLIVGFLLAVVPAFMFSLAGAVLPAPTLIVRWIGIMVFAYGLSAGIAAFNPVKFWPVLFCGLLAMAAMAVLTLIYLIGGRIPSGPGWIVTLLSVLWSIPYALVLGRIAATPVGGMPPPAPLQEDLNFEQYRTNQGRSLTALSNEAPVLLVLLRHLGCTFCRETLADIAACRREIESAGTRIVFVHMGDDKKANYLFERYRLEDIPRISDPQSNLYRALGLTRASVLQVYGPGMWKYVIQSVLLDGHGMGQIVGDRFQMPGAFLIHHGSVVGGFRHQRISDHPDYLSIVRCAAPVEDLQY